MAGGRDGRETVGRAAAARIPHRLGPAAQEANEAGESRRGLWTLFRSAFDLIAFDTGEALLRSHLRETTAGP